MFLLGAVWRRWFSGRLAVCSDHVVTGSVQFKLGARLEPFAALVAQEWPLLFVQDCQGDKEAELYHHGSSPNLLQAPQCCPLCVYQEILCIFTFVVLQP